MTHVKEAMPILFPLFPDAAPDHHIMHDITVKLKLQELVRLAKVRDSTEQLGCEGCFH